MSATSRSSALASPVDVDELFSAQELASLCPTSPLPLYHQLYEILRRRILSGQLGYRQLLPGETRLASLFQVSRITANRSLDLLAKEGLIRRERGIGTYVVYPPDAAGQHRLSADAASLHCLFLPSSTEVVSVEERNIAGTSLGKYFDPKSDPVALYISQLQHDEHGSPLCYHESWTIGIAGVSSKKALRYHSRAALLKRRGVCISHSNQILNAARVSKVAVGPLEMSRGDPVFILQQQSFDGSGRTVDLLISQYHPERFEFRVDRMREDDRIVTSSRVARSGKSPTKPMGSSSTAPQSTSSSRLK